MKTLTEYDRKRDFKKTPEPSGKLAKKKAKKLSFVVQEHHASHLHYDFRLELDGVLKSWAVPKGPSPDPKEKRLAMQVEDHPLAYGKFEGMIPEGEYGGGEVLLWDAGTWEPTIEPHVGLKKGHLDFVLKGKRMKGEWTLIRTGNQTGKPSWLLFKRSDEYAGKDSKFHRLKEYGAWKESPTKKKAEGKTKTPAKKKTAPASKKKLNFIEPQLPLLVDAPPRGKEWIHEIKFDGYRIQAHLQNGKAKLYTRSGQDWTHKYEVIAKALEEIHVQDAILDGEIVVLDAQGRSDFQELQLAMKNRRPKAFRYYVFDLMMADGEDLRELPLHERKDKLLDILPGGESQIQFSEHIEVDGEKMLGESCKQELEGIVSKDKNSVYASGRSSLWMKSKCTKRQEFVIGGYTEPRGARDHFGALLLGVYDEGKLKYVGRCGTGFNSETLSIVRRKMKSLESSSSPFDIKSPRERDVHFLKPKLVAEISFSNWTKDEILRVPVFHGLREDKSPLNIKREKEIPVKSAEKKEKKEKNEKKEKKTASLEAVVLTHPDKILYAQEKISKKEVADFYQSISKWILPHVSNRPLSLVRCPEGTGKACFFQKHIGAGQNNQGHLGEVSITERNGEKLYPVVESAEGLQTLVQMGCFELHAWGCRTPDIEHPDQIVMDFDPSPEVDFKAVKQGALELKEILDELNLKSFIKVTGGKGLHVHIPVDPIYSWDQIRDFSKALAQQMTDSFPDRYTATLSKAARTGKIFVDYLRNGRSATAVVPYSLRARKVSAVAMPISWADLKTLKDPAVFTLKKALVHLKKRKVDPWKGFEKVSQKISILKS